MALMTGVLDLIGDTPTVPLRRIFSRAEVAFFAKLEGMNLTGSMKARSVLGMIVAAESRGELRPGMTIVESTSGNLGLALAAIGALRGYEVILVIDTRVDGNRRAALLAHGARLEVVTEPDANGAYQTARCARRELLLRDLPNAWTPDQYRNPDNARAHYETTGPEIWRELHGELDVLVGAVGTCGHLAGSGRYLLERQPKLRVIGVEPVGSNVTGRSTYRPYRTPGSGLAFRPSCYDPDIIHEVWQVSDDVAFSTARDLVRKEAIFAGASSGSVVAVMRRLERELPAGSRVLGLLGDDGWRYTSNVYAEPEDGARPPGESE